MFLLLALFGPVLSLFSETAHKFSISEDSPPGSFIGQIPLQPGIQFRPSALPAELRLDGDKIFLASPVDREITPSLSFSLISSSPPAIIHIFINVEDVNDNSPAFPLAFQNVSVLETAPVGIRLPLVAATDPDEGENSRIDTYRLEGEEAFELVEDEGLIFLELKKPLDREHKNLYSFNLTAKDGGNPARIGWTSIYVQVLDVNDCAPEFPERRMITSWNGRKATPILTLKATDYDEGENSKLHYEVLGSQEEFEIRGDQLFSKINSPACCERVPCRECVIMVRAVDGGNPPLSTTAEVVVQFHGENQHDPEIHIRLQPSHVDFAVIHPDAEQGKAVAVLTVTDEDGPTGENGGLRIVNAEGLNFFKLSQQAEFWILRLARDGKEFVLPEYRVVFEASDGQNPPRTTRRSLIVYSEDQKSSQTKKEVHLTAKISETVPKGSFVVQVGANSTNHRFKIPEKEGATTIKIDEINGIVITNEEKLVPGRYSYDISVFPPPPAVQPYLVTLDLIIKDDNNHVPLFSAPDTVEIEEHTAIGTEVLKFEVEDLDLGNNGKISVHVLEGDDYVKIGKNSLILIKDLDYEEEKEFEVVLKAADHGKPQLSSRKTIIFQVKDSNNHAPFFPCQELHFSISALSPIGIEVGQVHAFDEDSPELTKLSYSLLDPTLLFTVNRNSGKIYTARMLEPRSYHLRIRATDQDGLKSSNNVTVSIHSSKLPLPNFSKVPSIELGNIEIGKEILKLTGHGAWKTDSPWISIDPSGALKLKALPQVPKVFLNVLLEKNNLSTSQCLEVNVKESPKAPKFKKRRLEIIVASTVPLGSQLEKVQACEKCFYSTDCPFLTIDGTGILKLARIFTSDKMICGITATDDLNREDRMEVIMTKMDHEETFHLPLYHEFFVNSNLSLGTIIGNLPASTVYLYTMKNPERMGIFPDGVLYVRRKLKAGEVYSFEVEARHKRLKNLHKTEVWIWVQHSQQIELICPEAYFKTMENNLAGTTVGVLDYPPSVKIRQIDGHDKVLMTPIGRVQILQSLDAEKVQNVTVKFELAQGISKKVCQLVIQVEDENELAPKFDKSFYRAIVPFEKSSGIIGKVAATDLDRDHKKIIYKLESHTQFLQINSTSGELSIRSHLPVDSVLNVSIKAIDSGRPQKEFITFFLLSTTNNLDQPVLFLDNSTIRISSSIGIGSVIGRTIATSGQNTLRILSEDPRFAVDSYGFIRFQGRPESLPKEFQVNFSTNGGHQARTIVVSDIISVKENSAPQLVQKVPSSTKILLTTPSSQSFTISNDNLLVTQPLDRETIPYYQILLEKDGEYFLTNVKVEDEPGHPPVCGNNIYLIDELPTTIKLKCWDPDMSSAILFWLKRKSPGIFVKSDGTLRVENLEEVVTRLEVEISNRGSEPISTTIILLSSKKDRSITFPSDNFNLLLSSSLENGQSFGRVAAEADSHLEYFLIGSDALSVNKDTGELLVKNKTDIQLRPEIREVFLLATSGIGISHVKIRVEIIEDALFVKRNTFIFQARSRLLGAFVGEFETGREDILLESHDERFFVKGNQLYLRRNLKNETSHLLIVELNAQKGRISSKITCYIILPQETNTLMFTIPENLPKGAVIGGSRLEGTASLEIANGILKTNEIFDRENVPFLNFTVLFDSGESIPALLVIEDENDNYPSFEKQKITVEVAENYEIGAALTRIVFNDSDTSNFFYFMIEEGNEMQQFEIDQWGLLKLRKELDFEAQKKHKLKVTLHDGVPPFPHHTVSCEVLIIVLDVNDSPPSMISPSSFTVQENIAIGTTIGAVTAKDPDSATIFYRIVPKTLPYAEIIIDPLFGYLQVNKAIDYERKMNFTFLVEISDGELSSQEWITVIVLDVNDNPPRFKGKEVEFQVPETVPIGYTITHFALDDLDSLDNSRSIFWLTGNFHHFRVGETSGVLFVARKLNYEKEKNITFTLHAKNIAEGTAIISRNIIVVLENKNDEAPRFLKGSPEILEIYENLPGPYPMVISTSVSEDEDEGDIVAYSLLSGNSSLFSVDSKTGDILLLTTLDREEEDEHKLFILATDSGKPRKSSTAEITIHVLDENDHVPRFLQPYYIASVLENVANGTEVLQVQAEDLDLGANAEITYRILEHGVPFWINPQSGKIIVRGDLDRESKELWEVTIEAMDHGQFERLSSKIPVQIKVEDINDNAPVILNTQMDVFVNGKIKKGEVIHVVDYFDADGDLVTLSLSGPDSSNFDVLKEGQIISLLDSLLMKSFYTVSVTVEDSGGKTAMATFTFYVDDAIFPSFSPVSPVQVPENTIQEVAIFNASTTKSYPANQIQYSILAGNDGSFEIEPRNGVLRLIKPLDREKKDFYRIWIRATDSDIPWKSSIQSVEVRVLDQNDMKPEFSQVVYRVKIKENEEPQNLITVSASDQDLGKNAVISYNISQGNDDSLFSIDERGTIRSVVPLDREAFSHHRLTITATDSGYPSLFQECLVLIEVEDEDDNSPKFTRLFHAEIPEDLSIGSEVILVSATDIDGSNSHSFSLEDGIGVFAINRTSGVITLEKELDREQTSSYRLRVRLDGVWTIFTSVQITVTDVNDNSPIFDRESYIFTTSFINQSPGRVAAKDLDEGSNGLVTYFIQDNSFVSINAENGELIIIEMSPNALEKITVTARDSGIPSRSSSVLVWILFNFSHLPPLTMIFPEDAKPGDIIWRIPKEHHLLSSPYFNLTNGEITLKVQPKNIPTILLEDLGALITVQNNSIMIRSLAIKISDKPLFIKFTLKSTRLLITQATPTGLQIGTMDVAGEGWRRFTVNQDVVEVKERGEIILKEELMEDRAIIAVTVVDIKGRNDTAQLILQKIPYSEKTRLEHKIRPLLCLASAPCCLTAANFSLENVSLTSRTDGVLVLEDGCFDFNGTIPKTLELETRENILKIPVLDATKRTSQKVPGIQKMNVEVTETSIGTTVIKIDKEEECSIEQEIGLQGYCIADSSLEISGSAKRTRYGFFVTKILCPSSTSFVDLHLTIKPEPKLVPQVIRIRENLEETKIAKLTLGTTETPLKIVNEGDKKIFSINQENVLSSSVKFDREKKTFYNIPVKSSSGSGTIRVLLDDVLDSAPLSTKNITVFFFGQLKREAKGPIYPATMDTVHDFKCQPIGNKDYLVSDSCEATIKQMPETPIILTSIVNSSSFTFEVSFIHKKLRLLRLDSALHLTFFGPSDGIAAFFSGLHTNFPDLKFYPLGISIKDQYFYSLVMGIADRHDKIVSTREAMSVVDSFLSSHPVLELLPTTSPTCTNYSMKIIHSGKHSPFRGIDYLWFVPEGEVEIRCANEKQVSGEKIQESIESLQKPETCSKKTCPDGICSIENGKVVCLRGDEEDICRDPSAVSLSNSHLEMIPTPHYHNLIQNNLKKEDCNDTWISIDFCTKTDGVLLSLENDHGLWTTLEIIKGVCVYRLSDGYRTPVEVPLTRVVTDNEWHTLSFKMMNNGKNIVLEVDGVGREATTKTALPLVLGDDLKMIQLGTDHSRKRFTGCVRRVIFNDYLVPFHDSKESQPLFFISAVGHISWSNGSSSYLRFSPTSTVIFAAILGVIIVVFPVYFISRLYFHWKNAKEPAWQETRDINAITIRHFPKNTSTSSSSTDSHIYEKPEERRPRETELASFERATSRSVRTVADVPLQIQRSTRKPYYRNEGYV